MGSADSLEAMLARIEARAPQATIALGLERVRAVRQRLAPLPEGLRVITVAGTNGKGSTVAFLERIAQAAGRRAFAYSSPHLVDFRERFRLDGRPVDRSAACAALQRVERARGEIALTWFEHVTLAGFELAAQARPDWLIAEVGLGGRLDAVNVIDPEVGVITNIGLDHQRWLGDTRAQIAREKCGIARPGRPIVVAEKRPPRGMLEHLEETGSRIVQVGADFNWRWRDDRVRIRIGSRDIAPTRLGLAGRHQAGNAAAAAAAALALEPGLETEAIRHGLARARLRGRFERLTRAPEVIVDVAHNPAAARVLADQLAGLPGRRFAVFAALEDKDVAGIVAPLAGLIEHWFVAPLPGARGVAAGTLVQRMALRDVDRRADALESIPAALAAARGCCRAGTDSVIVFGSFLTAAAAIRALEACRAA